MERLKLSWKRLPRRVRRPIVLVTGFFFVLLSGAVGWLPGPGGIPVLLLGIAILATEFTWADRVKDGILDYIHRAGHFVRTHKVLGSLIILGSLSFSGYLVYSSFFR